MNKFRARCFQKLAQAVTEPVAATNVPISGSPRGVAFIDGLPLTRIFGSAQPWIKVLAQYLDQLLYFSSPNKYSLQQLYNDPASIPATTIVDPNIRKIVEFSKVFLAYIVKLQYVPGMTKEQIVNYVTTVEQNPSLTSLTTNPLPNNIVNKISPTGPIKTNIINYLRTIKQSISTPVAPPAR
jgi:hypothetical protein